MTPMLTVTDLRKRYGELFAVDGVSFSVKQGECFGLLGPNGAGKTTTIEIMEGIITADAGHVHFKSQHKQPINEIIGIQFQQTALPDLLTVRETLRLFSSFYQHTLALPVVIDICQLRAFIDHDTRTLSGGERQRLLLALALINDPQIIFLDEPTTGLDPHSRRLFWQLIEQIKQRGKTIILTTHYMDEAHQLCDHIAIMNHGKIIERGAPEDLLNKHFTHSVIYLPLANVSSKQVTEHGWQVVANQVVIKTDNVERSVRQILLDNIALTGLHIKSATLDDLFLKLTGHSLEGQHD